MFNRFDLPNYIQNTSKTISDTLNYYVATCFDKLPLAIIEPLLGNSKSISINESQESMVNHLSIYPNPVSTTSSTTIALQNTPTEDITSYSVEIYDLSLYGKQWLKQSFTANQTTLNIPNNTLKAGFYVVKLLLNEQLIEMKTLRVD